MIKQIIVRIAALRTTGFAYITYGPSLINGLFKGTMLDRRTEHFMIGDGVNDAPAMANATVGIAMGGAGTDVALETADVTLMGDDLSKLPFAVGLGRATRSIVMQNLVIAMGVIVLLIITSLTGIVSIGIVIVFHEGSSLVVVANALRLLGYKEKHITG